MSSETRSDPGRELYLHFPMNLTPPDSVLTFSVPGGFEEPNSWTKHEPKVLELLEVPEAYLNELRRMLVANAFQTQGRLLCNFEAFYSIARMLFSLSEKTETNDWPLVSSMVRAYPPVIFKALGLQMRGYWTKGQYLLFTLDEYPADFAIDLAQLARTAGEFLRDLGPVSNKETELQLQ